MVPSRPSPENVHLRRSQTPFGRGGSVAVSLASTSRTNKRSGKSVHKRAPAIRIHCIGNLRGIWGTLLSVPRPRSFQRCAPQPKDASTASAQSDTTPRWPRMPRLGCSAALQVLHPPNWLMRSGQSTDRAVGGSAKLARTCIQDASEVTDHGSGLRVAA